MASVGVCPRLSARKYSNELIWNWLRTISTIDVLFGKEQLTNNILRTRYVSAVETLSDLPSYDRPKYIKFLYLTLFSSVV